MELTKKELTRLFGNITFGLSVALKLEPKIITLCENNIPCQLFQVKSKKLNNIIFCLYLDGQEFTSINIRCNLCRDIETITPETIIGEDLCKRKPQIILFNKNIPYEPETFLNSDDYTIYNFFKDTSQVECTNIVKHIKNIMSKYRAYDKLLKSITFTPDIDILLEI